jgi:transcriptional regulator with XRE-family HTH domain
MRSMGRYRIRDKGQRLVVIRRQQFMSQATLAAKAGSSPHTIGALERGQRDANAATVLRLADALDITPEELVDPDEIAPQERPRPPGSNEKASLLPLIPALIGMGASYI